ncbi:MAG: GNAT family N-acetyltransferase [Rhodomicrobium sp.]
MQAFELKSYDLGAGLLRPLSPENAEKFGAALAAMPPWSVIGWPAELLTAAFRRQPPSVRRFELLSGGELAGIVTIQAPFLHGPYLQLLAILPDFQGLNLGLSVLQWMEQQARAEEARQLWLCVSSFNVRARKFYERFGFEEVAVLDKLASEASDEIFMRKRLNYGASRR